MTPFSHRPGSRLVDRPVAAYGPPATAHTRASGDPPMCHTTSDRTWAPAHSAGLAGAAADQEIERGDAELILTAMAHIDARRASVDWRSGEQSRLREQIALGYLHAADHYLNAALLHYTRTFNLLHLDRVQRAAALPAALQADVGDRVRALEPMADQHGPDGPLALLEVMGAAVLRLRDRVEAAAPDLFALHVHPIDTLAHVLADLQAGR